MNWKDWLIIGLVLSLCLTLYLLKIQNQSRSQVIYRLSLRADSLQKQTTKSVIEYRDRVKNNTRIVEKWNTGYKVDSFTSIDTLYLEAKNDINYLDTSLKRCDTALQNCLALVSAKTEIIKALKPQKQPILVPYIGLGLSYNTKIQPSINAGVGINLNKLVGK